MSFDCRWSFPKSRFHLHRPSILMIFGPLPKTFRNVGMLQPAQQAFYGFALLRRQLANRFLHHLRAVGGGERLDLCDYLNCRHELSKSQVVNGVNLAAGAFKCLNHSLENEPKLIRRAWIDGEVEALRRERSGGIDNVQLAFTATLLGQASFKSLRIKTIG